MTLSDFLRLPWTVERSDHDDDGPYISLHIRELPGFVVAASTEEEVERMFWDALEVFLRSYTDAGETPPVPEAMLPQMPQLELLRESVTAFRPRKAAFSEKGSGTGASRRAQFA